jgi:hypothetical protein
MRPILLATLAACGALSVAGAQEWRTLDVSRQLRDASPLKATVVYGAGTFTLGAADGVNLYEVRMRYPAGNTTPIAAYNQGAHTLRLGITSKTFSIPGGDVDQNELHVGLARGVPLDLTTEVGAADVKIDLGGLSVQKLMLKTGATDATLRFSAPNAIPMQSMELNVGAAGFKATGLANARADHIVLRAGIGDWDLYFDGNWTGDITLDAKVGLGSLTIHVPDDVRIDQNAKVVLGAWSGDRSEPSVDTSTDDESDSADNSDDDSASTSTSASAKVSKTTHAAAKQAMKQVTPAPAAHHVLHINGSATLGEIQFDHKLAGAGGQ